MRGARSIYVDYVDYDEIAHHAGARGSSRWRRWPGSTRCWRSWRRWPQRAPRRYHVVALSDHGQSQGEPFASRYGIELSDLCRSLTRFGDRGTRGQHRGLGPGRLGAGGPRRHRRVPCRRPPPPGRATGSSSPRRPRARRADRPGERQPRTGLRAGPATADPRGDRGPVARSPARTGAHPGSASSARSRRRRSGGDRAHRPAPPGHRCRRGRRPAAAVRRPRPGDAAGRHVDARGAGPLRQQPLDPDTLEVAAFEPLVGCHGGLGGWQDRGFVLAPTHLLAPDQPDLGGDDLHQHLVGILEQLGHRTTLQRSTP